MGHLDTQELQFGWREHIFALKLIRDSYYQHHLPYPGSSGRMDEW